VNATNSFPGPYLWAAVDTVLERITEDEIDYYVPVLPEVMPDEELIKLQDRQVELVAATMQHIAIALAELHADHPAMTVPEIVSRMTARATEICPKTAREYEEALSGEDD
jgi:hypothetical protein